MKLKKIEVVGFKSFADKTAVEFHEGITCIVGPNGCGKSNIGDSIRWVLGEQSAKSMRGGKMPDLIFAGTSTRKAANFAEVTITFSEVQGKLPIDYDEIAITRRLYRDGESEYFINREPVRLKDIHHLFLDSGIGKSNFSFFEQGKIDQIIQLPPMERRSIFEEAAGIGRFLQRKKETLRKLDDVGVNLNRLSDIQSEVERQVSLLEEQAVQANEYKQSRERLEILEKGHLLSRFDSYEKRARDLKGKEGELKSDYQNYQKDKGLLDEQCQDSRAFLDEEEVAYRKMREEFLKKQGDKELKLQSRGTTYERLEEIKGQQLKAEKEIQTLEAQRNIWATEIKCLRESKEQLAREAVDKKKVAESLAASFQKVEKELASFRAKQTNSHQERVQQIQRESNLDSEKKQQELRLENHQEKKAQLTSRIEQLERLRIEKNDEVKAKKRAFQELCEASDESKKKLRSAEDALKTMNAEIDKAQRQNEQISREASEVKARHHALLRLKEDFEGFSLGSKKLLKEAQDPKSPLYGLLKALYEYISADPQSQAAISSVLKPYAQTLVVPTEHDLRVVVEFALSRGIKDFSIFCLEFVKPGKALENTLLQKADSNALVEHFLGRIVLVEDSDEALSVVRKTQVEAWSASGCFVDSRSVLFYSQAQDHSVFAREAEIKSLAKKSEIFEIEKKQVDEQVKKLFQEKQKLQELRTAADIEVRKAEMKGVEANFVLQKTEQDLQRLQKEIAQVSQEIQGSEETILTISKRLTELESAFLAAKQKSRELLEATDALNAHLSKISEGWKEEQEAYQRAQFALQDIEDKSRKAVHALNLLEVKDQESERLLERLKQEVSAAKKMQHELSLKSTVSDGELKRLEEELNGLQNKIAAKQESLEGQKALLAKLDEERKKFEHLIKDVEGKLNQMSIQLAHLETGQGAIIQELKDRFNIEVDELRQSVPALQGSLEKTEKEIKQLRAQLESRQNVNLAAIDECAKQKERAEFLKEQIGDLTGSKEDLLAIIASLDKECRELFQKTFTEVRANFQKNFQILFKGGEADLELTESEDILEAGIEITAKPPGKQMRSLSLLSGGEKCLTAMALLFAIFEVKASPFCILDEIDAPLDDSNVERFVNVVKQFIDRCQFIVVTHNKRTMAIADRLYGVSMQEKGVSKLLAMEFSKQAKPQPVLV